VRGSHQSPEGGYAGGVGILSGVIGGWATVPIGGYGERGDQYICVGGYGQRDVARWEMGDGGDGRERRWEVEGLGKHRLCGCWTRKNQRGQVLDEKKTGGAVVDENKPTECTSGGKRNTFVLFK
jgi:hypothetical protein